MPLPWHSDDRIIWLTLFTATLAVSYLCFDALTSLDSATETIEPAKQFCVVNQETEDQIKAADLAVLARHPVRSISEAAIKILVARAAHDESVKKAIEADVCSEDDKLARRATQGLRMIQRYEPDTFDFPFRRPGQQRTRETADDGAESVLGELLGTLDRGGEDVDENYMDAIDDYLALGEDSQQSNIFGEPLVRGGAVREMARDAMSLSDFLVDAEGNGNIVPRTRERDGSPSEQARRRRRREAIVLHEGSQPLTEEDIIQRRRTDT